MRVFEHHRERLLPRAEFLRRVARFAGIAAGMVGAALAIGASGYHWIAGLPWVDSVLNASMILSGMGPVDRMEHTAGKLFAAGYALFSGIAFVTTVAVLFAPVVHRFLHALHLEASERESWKEDR